MQEQWTIGTTVSHTIIGDAAVLNANKEGILNAINIAVNIAITQISFANNSILDGVTLVEDHVADSIIECTTEI